MYNPEGQLSNKAWKRQTYDCLPGFMTTKPGSNNAKLLNIITRLANTYKNDLLMFTDQNNINNATGDLLTALAADYNVARIDNDDEFLRFEVKFNMIKNNMAPSVNSFTTMMSYLMDLSARDFNITQTGLKEYKITNIPWNFHSGKNTKLKREMVATVVQAVSPPEFKLDYIEYTKDTRTTRYRATAVNKTVFKRVRPKSMDYLTQYMYK